MLGSLSIKYLFKSNPVAAFSSIVAAKEVGLAEKTLACGAKALEPEAKRSKRELEKAIFMVKGLDIKEVIA